jgi:pyroglutamyl-peptidase
MTAGSSEIPEQTALDSDTRLVVAISSPDARLSLSMAAQRSLILLTGFGPFPSVSENASSLLVPEIAAEASRIFRGFAVRAELIPTEWRAGGLRLSLLMTELRPAIALHFGVSSKALGFVIEARGRNFASAVSDAAGELPSDRWIAPGGPDYLPTNLPAALIVARLRRRGLPAFISRDAGAYLCNAVLYRSLDIVRRSGPMMRNGFIHIPSTLHNERCPGSRPRSTCPLRWEQAIDGGLEIIAATLGRPPPPPVFPQRRSPVQATRPTSRRPLPFRS